MRSRTLGLLLWPCLLALAACNDRITTPPSDPPPDLIPPTILLTTPAAVVVTQADAVMRGTATDAVGVERIAFALNGAAAQDIAITPGSTVEFEFTVGGLEAGANTIAISAYDAAGNQTEVRRHVDYAVVRYQVVITDGLGAGWSFPRAISAAGDLAGVWTPGRDDQWGFPENDHHGFVSTGADLMSMPPPTGYHSSAVTGFNTSGRVVGYADLMVEEGSTEYPGRYRVDLPIVWEGAQPSVLPLPPGFAEGGAMAVNEDGIIAGYINDISWDTWAAVIWRDGGVIPLAVPGGGDAVGSDINRNGVVAGDFWSGGIPRAFRWENGVTTALPPLDGYSSSGGFAINDAGDVVGFSYTPGQQPATEATLWVGNTAMSLGRFPGHIYYRAWAINNRGQAVGHMDADIQAGNFEGTFRKAFISQDGRMSMLNHLAGDEWDIIEATAINDAGQIAAYAFHRESGSLGSGSYRTIRLDPVESTSGAVSSGSMPTAHTARAAADRSVLDVRPRSALDRLRDGRGRR
jgi:uncharacterized membrane protein